MTRQGNAFRIWVKTRLLERDLTVDALAEEIGYPRRTVSAAINGAPYPHAIQAIADFFHHDPKTDCPLPASPARPERRVRLRSQRKG